MDNGKVTRYFLGANSHKGFYSLYDSLARLGEGEFLWVIKGGPGCGKSSFMKRLGAGAEESGLPVEYIHCSGDPRSLDAVRFPTLKTAYVDGTSPHVIEAVYPGCGSLYLDLGAFYDAGALESSLGEVVRLNREYKGMYARAYAFLAAAGSVAPKRLYPLRTDRELEKLRKKAAGIVSREMKELGRQGRERSVFLRAISCEGVVSFDGSVSALCERVCTLDNEYGLAAPLLDEVSAAALSRGYDIVTGRDPLFPDVREAVLIPALSLGFVAVDRQRSYSGDVYRHLRLDAMLEAGRVAAQRREFRETSKLQDSLLNSAVSTLAGAKALHDELEAVYNPHVDFDGIYRTAEDHKTWLLGK